MALSRHVILVILVLVIKYCSIDGNFNSKHVAKSHHHHNHKVASKENQYKHDNNLKTNIKNDDEDEDDDDDIVDNENEIINTIAPAQPDPNIDNEFIEPHDVVHDAIVDFIVIKHRFSNTTNLAFPAYVNTRHNTRKGFNKDKFGKNAKISGKKQYRHTATS